MPWNKNWIRRLFSSVFISILWRVKNSQRRRKKSVVREIRRSLQGTKSHTSHTLNSRNPKWIITANEVSPSITLWRVNLCCPFVKTTKYVILQRGRQSSDETFSYYIHSNTHTHTLSCISNEHKFHSLIQVRKIVYEKTFFHICLGGQKKELSGLSKRVEFFIHSFLIYLVTKEENESRREGK